MIRNAKRKLFVLLAMVMLVLVGCGNTVGEKDSLTTKETLQPTQTAEVTVTEAPTMAPTEAQTPSTTPTKTAAPIDSQTEVPSDNKVDSNLEVHFIDCGQGDSILLRSEGETMLVDAGNNKYGKAIVAYLEKQGIKKLNYVIGTHPDADHIGGLDNVINSFDIGKVYMPKKQNNTRTFEDVLTAIKNKGLKISSPKPGTKITLGSATLTILGPINYYEDDNNDNSIVIRAVHGKNSFLLMGDAGLQEEMDIMEAGSALSSTVLKVGHHGSSTSTSRYFLEKVKPTYAIISCGEDNQYGHPHEETMTYLDMFGVKFYRTDKQKTICMISDGKSLDITTNNPSAMGKGSGSNSTANKKEETKVEENKQDKETGSNQKNAYIGNKNTKKFHVSSCRSLPAKKNRVYFNARKDAINSGYNACGICHP